MENNIFFNRNKVHKKLNVVETGEFKNGLGTTYYTSYTDGKETTIALGFCGAKNLNFEDGLTRDVASTSSLNLLENEFGLLTSNYDTKKILAQAASGIVSEDPRQRVILAHHLYHSYVSGVIRTYVDFMTEIAIDGLKIKVNKKYNKDKEKIERFFKALFFDDEKNNNNLPRQVENIVLDLVTCNNAFVWTVKAPYTNKYFQSIKEIEVNDKNRKKLKSTKAAFLEKNIYDKNNNKIESKEFVLYNQNENKYLDKDGALIWAARKKKWSKKELPNVITTLSPASIDIDGVSFGNIKQYKIMLDKKFIEAVRDAKEKGYEDAISPELLNRLNVQDSFLSFKPHEIIHLKTKTPDYLLWGEPKILAALEPIARRKRRVIGDEQAASRLIRQILLVKIGNDKYVASKEQIVAAASLFKDIGTTGTIFWNHLMEIEPIAPQDIADLLKQENYEQVENEIYESLGFPMFLSGRTTSINFSMATHLVRPIVHFIQSIRKVLKQEFLSPLARETCNTMEFPEDAVEFTFNTNILEDYDQLAKRLVSYAQNKVASVESVVERLPDDLDWDDEKKKFNEEFKDIKDGKYGMSEPVGKAGRPGAGRPDNDPSPESVKKEKISPKGTGTNPKQKQSVAENSTDVNLEEKVRNEIHSLLAEVIQRRYDAQN